MGNSSLCNDLPKEQENTPDVVSGMMKVVTFDVYTLIDQLISLCFVTPYVVNYFEIFP